MTIKTKPEDFERRILLTLAGHSPAIITETLYALTQQQAYVPTEIHVITTSSGQEKLISTLLGDNGVLARFCNEYGVTIPKFTEAFIHVITDANGAMLHDLQTEADNEAAADFITAKVRELTQDENTSLHVSIAGGRKTMTYYLGYAMSVFGRVQDRMSHVLVEDDYAIPGFYYPTKQSHIITNSRTGKSFDAKDVKVMLGELPFIRLRDGLTDDLLNDERKKYSEIIEIAQRQLAPISVRVVFGKEPKLYCGGEEIKLPPAQLALYVWMLQRHKDKKPAVHFTDKKTKAELAEEFKAVYAELSNMSGHYTNAEEIIKSMDTDYFGAPRTNINKKLNATLGKPKAKAYLLLSSGGKNAMQYKLSDDLMPEHITSEQVSHSLKRIF